MRRYCAVICFTCLPLSLGAVALTQAADAPAQNDGYPVEGCVLMPVKGGEVLVPAEEAGVLDQLEVREGMKVTAGQFLAQIKDDKPQYQKKLAELEAEAAKVQAENDVDIKLAEMMVKITQVDFQEGKRARARVENALSEFEMRRREFQWQRSILQGVQAERDFRVAGINAAAAEQKVAVAQNEIDRRQVKARLAGVVERIYPHVGEWLNPGDPILRLVGMDRLMVEGFVESEDYSPHELFGKPVTVEVHVKQGQTERFTSKINFVSPTVDADGKFRIAAEVENRMTNDTYYVVWPGLTARMILHTQTAVTSTTPRR